MAAGSSSGGSSSAVRAGRAFIELFATDTGVLKVLDRLKQRFEKFGAQIGKIGAITAAAGATFTAPFALMAKHAIDAGSAIADVASRLGATTDEVQTLTYAASLAGGGIEDIEKAMSKLRTGIAEGSLFGSLDLATLQGKDLTDQLKAVADEIASIQGADKQLAAASAIFGEKQGRKMLTFLREGAAGIDRMGQRAKDIGILGPEQVDTLDRAGDALGEIKMLVENLSSNVVLAVLGDPADIESGTNSIIEFGGTIRRFITDNAEVIKTVAMVAGGILAVGTAVAAVGGLIMGFGAVIGGLLSVVSAISFFISPAGLIVLGLTALAAGLAIAASETETFSEILGTFTEAWQGIKDAIAAGDLSLAFNIAWAGVKVVTNKAISALEVGWIEFKFFFLELWDNIVNGVRIAMAEVAKTIPDSLAAVAPALALIKSGLLQGSTDEELARANDIDRRRKADKKKQLEDAMKDNGVGAEFDALTAQAAAAKDEANRNREWEEMNRRFLEMELAGDKLTQKFGGADFAKGAFGFEKNLSASLGVADDAKRETNNLLEKILEKNEVVAKALTSGTPLVVGV